MIKRLFIYLLIAIAIVLLFGCGGGGSSQPDTSSNGQEDPGELWVSDDCPALTPGVATGAACLHCGNATALTQALELADVVAKTCRENVATTFLLDGSFKDTPEQVNRLVDVMTRNGSTLHAYIYLSNGPWQRRSDDPGLGVGNTLKPEQFRNAIQFDEGLRNSYRNNIARILPALNHISAIGGKLYIIPTLEDNNNDAAYKAIELLTKQEMDKHLLAYAIGRNPCTGCYDGNTGTINPGTFKDVHPTSPHFQLPANGLVTNDGKTFVFPGDNESGLTVSDIERIIDSAHSVNAPFVLWTRKFQGIGAGNTFPHPDNRRYAIPNEDDKQLMISLLK